MWKIIVTNSTEVLPCNKKILQQKADQGNNRHRTIHLHNWAFLHSLDFLQLDALDAPTVFDRDHTPRVFSSLAFDNQHQFHQHWNSIYNRSADHWKSSNLLNNKRSHACNQNQMLVCNRTPSVEWYPGGSICFFLPEDRLERTITCFLPEMDMKFVRFFANSTIIPCKRPYQVLYLTKILSTVSWKSRSTQHYSSHIFTKRAQTQKNTSKVSCYLCW